MRLAEICVPALLRSAELGFGVVVIGIIMGEP